MSDLRILLVDDDDDDHLLTRQLVRRIDGGHRLDRAATFEDGLAWVLRREHDVYLVDLRLGARSGLDLVREALAAGVRAPFILLTGAGHHDVDVEAMRAGASDYIEKAGATPDLLERSIRYALERARSIDELESRAEKQAAVAQLGQLALTGGGGLGALFDAALARIAGALGVELVAVLELLPGGHELTVRAGSGWPPGIVGLRVPASLESQCGYTLRCNEAVVVEDLARETRFVPHPALGSQKVVSGVTVLIRSVDGACGVLGAHTRTRRAFSPDDVNFLQGVANVLGSAIARARSDRGLRESEERYRLVFEIAREGILATDAQGTITFANPHMATMLGRTIADLILQPLIAFTSSDGRERARADVDGMCRGATQFDLRFRRPDGSTLWTIVSTSPITGRDGAVIGALGMVTDITGRKAAEDALRESRGLLEHALEVGGIGSWTSSLGGDQTVTWSPQARRIMGIAADVPMTRELFYGLVHEGDRASNEALVLRAVEERSTYENEFRVVRPDGQVRWIHARAHVILDAADEPVMLLGVCQDVTERTQAEVALKESVTSLRAVFDASLDAILIADDEGRYLDANPAACKLLGLPRGELLGRSVADFVPSDRRAETATMWPQFLHDGTSRGNLTLARAGDGLREVEFAATANFLPGRHVSVLRDVTERKLLEEQLRQAQKMEAVGRLAGGVAHDYNNILTAILGYGELISNALHEGDPIRRQAGEILKAGRRAAGLTRQLLAFSRKQLLQPTVLNPNAVVEGLVSMLRRLVGEDVDLTTALAPELGNTKADAGQLEQVLVNLVVNARDAMPRGGKLTIQTANGAGPLHGTFFDEDSARRRGEVDLGPHVSIKVTDCGCGMGEETLAHLFEPFFTTKPLGKGTGLGLSTVYGIIKQSGGFISVESEVGRGTTFCIYLPRVDAAPDQVAPPPTGPPKRGREVILLVEDEDLVRTLAAEILALHGYTVLTASNGGEALLICESRRGPIDLVLTDVVMPNLSGGELVQRARLSRPDLRVLYISGYTDDAIVHHGVLDGGAAFLNKPFLAQALCEKVREVLDEAVVTA